MRAAFATKDGKFISQHFGHTPYFCIVEIDEDTFTWRVLEQRESIPPCRFGEHDEALFAQRILSISDCSVLFAAKVGPYARAALERNHIQVLEMVGFIEEVLEGYIAYLKKQKRRREFLETGLRTEN